MAKGEEPLGSGDISIAGVVVLETEATARGDDVEVGPRESLLPLQDPWYCSSSLFPVVRAPEFSPPKVPKKWILKGEAPSHETVWLPATSSILNLRFQRKELLSLLEKLLLARVLMPLLLLEELLLVCPTKDTLSLQPFMMHTIVKSPQV